MSKISCDVTRDLLASYMDGVCSEESRGLVEEHLKECGSCKRFMEQVQEQDLGKDAVKMDFLKRVRQSVNIQIWLVVALALALIFIGHPHIQYQPLDLLLYYIVMPILMLISTVAPVSCRTKSLSSKREWILPVLGAAIVCAALILQVMAIGFISGKAALPRPMNEMGTWLEWRYTFIAVLSAALLVLSFIRLKSRTSVFIVSQNFAWLGMNLALSCDTLLYHMEDELTVSKCFWNNFLILTLEFVVMTALMLVFYHIKDKKEMTIKA